MGVQLDKNEQGDSLNIDSKTIQTKATEGNTSAKQKLFAHPFSIKGRIRRLEFGLSNIIYVLSMVCVDTLSNESPILGLLVIPFVWFILAQSCKRFHDMNITGVWIFTLIIPFYNIYMFLMLLFADGDDHENEYGPDPKGRS